MKGIDCATTITAAVAKKLKGEGVQFVGRYIVPDSWKTMKPAEAKIILDHGMGILSIYQLGKDRPTGGAATARVDGPNAIKAAKALGQPQGSAIYFAVDFDAQTQHMNMIEQHLRTLKEILHQSGYRVGLYGSYSVIEEMSRRKAADCYWQTYAWSRGQTSKSRNVYQYQNDVPYCGIQVDHNMSCGGEGIWGIEEEDQEMIDALKKEVADLKRQLQDMTQGQEPPTWAKGSVEKAMKAGVITDKKGSHDFHRMIVTMDRAGMFDKGGK